MSDSAQGIEAELTHKVGPFPVWLWAGVGIGVLLLLFKGSGGGGSSSSTAPTDASGLDGASLADVGGAGVDAGTLDFGPLSLPSSDGFFTDPVPALVDGGNPTSADVGSSTLDVAAVQTSPPAGTAAPANVTTSTDPAATFGPAPIVISPLDPTGLGRGAPVLDTGVAGTDGGFAYTDTGGQLVGHGPVVENDLADVVSAYSPPPSSSPVENVIATTTATAGLDAAEPTIARGGAVTLPGGVLTGHGGVEG